MHRSDKKQFASLMMAVAENYGRQYGDGLLGMWWHALAGYDFAQVRRAIQSHVESERFAPTLADIKQVLDGSDRLEDVEAWGKLLEAVETVGSYKGVVFDDPAIHAAIRTLGGWAEVCSMDLDQWAQRRFLSTYRPVRDALDQAPDSIYRHVPEIECWGRHKPRRQIDGRWDVPVGLVGDRSRLKVWTAEYRRQAVGGAPVARMIEGVGRREKKSVDST